jgi:hypothetical protein
MQRLKDGSAVLSQEEASVVAKVLDLGRSLCEDMGARHYDNQEHHLEVQLIETIDFLEELGVSSDELTGKLEQRPRTG